jgi:hypothetical protein
MVRSPFASLRRDKRVKREAREVQGVGLAPKVFGV